MFSPLHQLLANWSSHLRSLLTSYASQSSATTKELELNDDSSKHCAKNPLESSQLEQITREIQQGRKFSLAEAIGRETSHFLRDQSAIPRPLRAKAKVDQFISTQLNEPTGPIATTLRNWTSTDIRLSSQLDTPLIALAQITDSILSEPTTFCEFSRQVAIAQAKLTGDRPYFQTYGKAPHPNADYPHSIIKHELSELLHQLKVQNQPSN